MGAAPVRVVVLEVDITTRTRMVAAGVTATAPGTATVEEETGEVSEVVEEGSAAEIETGTEAGMEDTKKGEKKRKRNIPRLRLMCVTNEDPIDRKRC